MSNFGLKEEEEQLLKSIFSKYDSLNKVIVYGSRAKGTFNERSDLDLVITESNIDRSLIGQIISEINNSNFPYLLDLQDFSTLKNKQLIDHIDRVGKVFYSRVNSV
jgi:predicted nucleotidyltransferase